MIKNDLLKGFLIGILGSFVGSYIFIRFFTDFNFIPGIQILKSQGQLGKIITLGSILDLVTFSILLKLNKDIMARGVVLAVIVMTVFTLFV